MNRRALLLGLGSTAAGTAAVLGTGAFSAAQVRGRETDISVVNDAQGLIGLVPNDEIAGVELSNGELTVSLDEKGINVNSIYQFGYFAEDPSPQEGDVTPPQEVEGTFQEVETIVSNGTFPLVTDDPTQTVDGSFKSAFLVRNQTDNPTDVALSFEVDGSGSDPGDTVFLFEAHYVDDDGNTDTDSVVYESGSEMDLSVKPLAPGEEMGVSFLVDSTDGNVDDDFTASLSVTAGEAVETE